MPASTTTYSCSLQGHCEPDPFGLFPLLTHCQANCHSYGSATTDLYDAYTYTLEDALSLSPSDISIILQRLTTVTIHPSHARTVLSLLIDEDYISLWGVNQEMRDYLLPNLTLIDLVILDVFDRVRVGRRSQGFIITSSIPDWQALSTRVETGVRQLWKQSLSSSSAELMRGIVSLIDVTALGAPVTPIDQLTTAVAGYWDDLQATYGNQL